MKGKLLLILVVGAVLIGSAIAANYLGAINILGYTRISNLNATKASLGQTNVTDLITRGPWVDVRAFGAKGDNSTDDWLAIQNAINYTYFIGGGIVYFPQGIYLISKAILLTDDNQISTLNRIKEAPITLMGVGASKLTTSQGDYIGTVLRRKTAGDIIRININSAGMGYNHGALGITIQDLSFHCNESVNITAIRAYRLEDSVMQRLSSKDCTTVMNFSNPGVFVGGEDYPQMSTFRDIKAAYSRSSGGKGNAIITMRYGETNIIQRISSDGMFNIGIKLYYPIDFNIQALTLNHMGTSVQCTYCQSTEISGVHSEDITSRFMQFVNSRGLTVSGFTLNAREKVNVTAFRVENSKEITVQDGYIRFNETGGNDLQTFSPSTSVSMRNVRFLNLDESTRSMRTDVVDTAWAVFAADSEILGKTMNFIKLSSNTTRLFSVTRAGNLFTVQNVTVGKAIGVNFTYGAALTAPLDINGKTIRLRQVINNASSCVKGEQGWNQTSECRCTSTNVWRCIKYTS